MEKGGYPKTLNALVEADFLKQLPMDPYSDKPFVYRKTDDGFILYSVGNNFKDDGGIVIRDSEGTPKWWYEWNNKEGDVVFWSLGE